MTGRRRPRSSGALESSAGCVVDVARSCRSHSPGAPAVRCDRHALDELPGGACMGDTAEEALLGSPSQARASSSCTPPRLLPGLGAYEALKSAAWADGMTVTGPSTHACALRAASPPSRRRRRALATTDELWHGVDINPVPRWWPKPSLGVRRHGPVGAGGARHRVWSRPRLHLLSGAARRRWALRVSASLGPGVPWARERGCDIGQPRLTRLFLHWSFDYGDNRYRCDSAPSSRVRAILGAWSVCSSSRRRPSRREGGCSSNSPS